MALNTIIGQAATGENFFPRPKLIEKLWQKIKTNHNILITAPRRVGKTSILKFISDNPNPNYLPIYIITESVNNENEFFRKIFKELIQLLSKTDKVKTQILALIKTNKITSISKDGITIESKQMSYFEELISVIEQLDLEGYKVVFIIDEFAQSVENIIEDENSTNGKHFLEKNRELRHLDSLKGKISFIYAGSIGLENIVSKINAINTINDLFPFEIPPFTTTEAKGLIKQLTSEDEWKIDDEFTDYLFNKIGWLLPFYLQIVINELNFLEGFNPQSISIENIDIAINNSIKQRLYFEHWLTRLRKAYTGNDFKFAKEILNMTSDKGEISKSQISNIADKHDLENTFIDIINALMHDGYINNLGDIRTYQYNSPLLRIWWNNNVNF